MRIILFYLIDRFHGLRNARTVLKIFQELSFVHYNNNIELRLSNKLKARTIVIAKFYNYTM